MIAAQKDNLGACYIFGGKAAVSEVVENAVKAASL